MTRPRRIMQRRGPVSICRMRRVPAALDGAAKALKIAIACCRQSTGEVDASGVSCIPRSAYKPLGVVPSSLHP